MDKKVMSVVHFQEKALHDIVDSYIDSRGNSDWPISVAQAVRTVRTLMPRADISDRKLVELVASSAVIKRRNVAFDFRPEDAAKQ